MTTIMLCREPAYAPCCFIIARQREDGTYDPCDESNTVLIQTDYDYPGLASTFGYFQRRGGHPKRCRHAGTDGTVDCPDCGKTASAFICEASDWFHDNVGATAEDPGYFDD